MGFYCERELEIGHNWNILTPNLWPSRLCLSRSSDAHPEALGSTLLGVGFLYCILPASFLDPNSSGPQAPSAWCGFPYHNFPPTGCNSTGSFNLLYNRSTPTRSLKSNVQSSSSGNNCHAVQRSLSSGASVYECIMGFTLSYFICQFPPTRFPLITAIRMCHLLPVHHLGMAFFGRVKGQNITQRIFTLRLFCLHRFRQFHLFYYNVKYKIE